VRRLERAFPPGEPLGLGQPTMGGLVAVTVGPVDHQDRVRWCLVSAHRGDVCELRPEMEVPHVSGIREDVVLFVHDVPFRLWLVVPTVVDMVCVVKRAAPGLEPGMYAVAAGCCYLVAVKMNPASPARRSAVPSPLPPSRSASNTAYPHPVVKWIVPSLRTPRHPRTLVMSNPSQLMSLATSRLAIR